MFTGPSETKEMTCPPVEAIWGFQGPYILSGRMTGLAWRILEKLIRFLLFFMRVFISHRVNLILEWWKTFLRIWDCLNYQENLLPHYMQILIWMRQQDLMALVLNFCKVFSSKLSLLILCMLNHSMRSSRLPTTLYKANISLIPKPGLDPYFEVFLSSYFFAAYWNQIDLDLPLWSGLSSSIHTLLPLLSPTKIFHAFLQSIVGPARGAPSLLFYFL